MVSEVSPERCIGLTPPRPAAPRARRAKVHLEATGWHDARQLVPRRRRNHPPAGWVRERRRAGQVTGRAAPRVRRLREHTGARECRLGRLPRRGRRDALNCVSGHVLEQQRVGEAERPRKGGRVVLGLAHRVDQSNQLRTRRQEGAHLGRLRSAQPVGRRLAQGAPRALLARGQSRRRQRVVTYKAKAGEVVLARGPHPRPDEAEQRLHLSPPLVGHGVHLQPRPRRLRLVGRPAVDGRRGAQRQRPALKHSGRQPELWGRRINCPATRRAQRLVLSPQPPGRAPPPRLAQPQRGRAHVAQRRLAPLPQLRVHHLLAQVLINESNGQLARRHRHPRRQYRRRSHVGGCLRPDALG
eukprot:scaffold4756_cov116-Isochrysis_galbana.AAC.13